MKPATPGRVVAAIGLGLVLVGGAAAQDELAKALVGTWQGDVRIPRAGADEGRTLVIDRVSQQDGKWVANGRFGITGKRLGRVQVDVDPAGGKPWLRFTTPVGTTVRLQLLDEKNLVGNLTIAGSGSRDADRPIRLEKTP